MSHPADRYLSIVLPRSCIRLLTSPSVQVMFGEITEIGTICCSIAMNVTSGRRFVPRSCLRAEREAVRERSDWWSRERDGWMAPRGGSGVVRSLPEIVRVPCRRGAQCLTSGDFRLRRSSMTLSRST